MYIIVTLTDFKAKKKNFILANYIKILNNSINLNNNFNYNYFEC
jgi:hypothetical protein